MVAAQREIQRTAEPADHVEALGEHGHRGGEFAAAQVGGGQRVQRVGQPGGCRRARSTATASSARARAAAGSAC
ncbi:hypothetical protein PQR15_37555 [Streptomyces lydicus]|nr:hypothetical protein [Streptomyces lydicus]